MKEFCKIVSVAVFVFLHCWLQQRRKCQIKQNYS